MRALPWMLAGSFLLVSLTAGAPGTAVFSGDLGYEGLGRTCSGVPVVMAIDLVSGSGSVDGDDPAITGGTIPLDAGCGFAYEFPPGTCSKAPGTAFAWVGEGLCPPTLGSDFPVDLRVNKNGKVSGTLGTCTLDSIEVFGTLHRLA